MGYFRTVRDIDRLDISENKTTTQKIMFIREKQNEKKKPTTQRY
jgi:hypothetical protein